MSLVLVACDADTQLRCVCGAELALPGELRGGSCEECRMFCERCGEQVGTVHRDGSATLCDGCAAEPG